ncbi:hypothetical protein IWQ47_001165 [Aquimarina sp. EL_43]|uniref:hypothetical protein n=1 Tax=Aquimarina TaxID=290174 RepID=UPI00046F8485|nr:MULTISPECIES: hypothetical protein [Aquimarina]MBG6129532.1 hypothetical protein [Aquimarina sp. EL_35]MBG6150597.1 hypothetical protein [Aquimarina sp. EL_32]MBG6168095.1 hypothetical protein [Aquimarina sp. EL_43]
MRNSDILLYNKPRLKLFRILRKRHYVLVVGVVCSVFLSGKQIHAQEKETDANGVVDKKSKLAIGGFSYSGLSSREQHAYFTIDYKVNSNLFIELQGYNDTYLSADVFKMPIRGKLQLTNKFHFFSGLEIELTRNVDIHDIEVPLQTKFIYGMGYDFDTNFSLEVNHNLNFGTSEFGYYGTPNLLYVRGRYRF